MYIDYRGNWCGTEYGQEEGPYKLYLLHFGEWYKVANSNSYSDLIKETETNRIVNMKFAKYKIRFEQEYEYCDILEEVISKEEDYTIKTLWRDFSKKTKGWYWMKVFFHFGNKELYRWGSYMGTEKDGKVEWKKRDK